MTYCERMSEKRNVSRINASGKKMICELSMGLELEIWLSKIMNNWVSPVFGKMHWYTLYHSKENLAIRD